MGVGPKKFFTVLIEPNRNQNRFAYQVQRISIVGLRVIPVLQFQGSELPCCKIVTNPESLQEMPGWPAPRPRRNACARRAHAQPSARSHPTSMSRYVHRRRSEAILPFRPIRERPFRQSGDNSPGEQSRGGTRRSAENGLSPGSSPAPKTAGHRDVWHRAAPIAPVAG